MGGRVRKPKRAVRPQAVLNVEVVWGSITDAPGDVHVVGHYQGVLPQNAERALDLAVSARREQLVITDLTRRGVIRGALGDVNFIPWDATRTAAIAGMGAPGTFQGPQLRKLIASVASTVGLLSGLRELTSVLIGSGAGNLPIEECVQAYLDGLSDAFAAYPSLEVRRLRLVELNLDRAITMLRFLERKNTGRPRSVRFKVKPALTEGKGRQVPLSFSYSMLLAAVARQTRSRRKELSPWLQGLLRQLPALPKVERNVVGALREHAKKHPDLRRLALCFPIAPEGTALRPKEIPTRIVFGFDGRHVRTSAITETTTVTEREVGIRQEQFDELVLDLSQSNRLSLKEAESLARFGFRRLLHGELASVFTADRSMILEMNRSIAALPFEMLMPDGFERPLSVTIPLARQLRTIYSPPPVSAPERRITRALVIGDPGEGDLLLPECRLEAEHVRDLLSTAGISTTLLVGSPRDVTTRPPRNSQPASIVAVQKHLFNGVDLVHYCGHGTYEPDRPDLSGWVFGNGAILTAEDLRQLPTAPLLVVANACLSSLVSQRARSRATNAARTRQTSRAETSRSSDTEGLIAGLADEFFRLGVRDFVGAAFTVPDTRARIFSTHFYRALFVKGGASIGQAVLQARRKLYDDWRSSRDRARRAPRNLSPAWGAYQHYGDPTRDFGTRPG